MPYCAKRRRPGEDIATGKQVVTFDPNAMVTDQAAAKTDGQL